MKISVDDRFVNLPEKDQEEYLESVTRLTQLKSSLSFTKRQIRTGDIKGIIGNDRLAKEIGETYMEIIQLESKIEMMETNMRR